MKIFLPSKKSVVLLGLVAAATVLPQSAIVFVQAQEASSDNNNNNNNNGVAESPSLDSGLNTNDAPPTTAVSFENCENNDPPNGITLMIGFQDLCATTECAVLVMERAGIQPDAYTHLTGIGMMMLNQYTTEDLTRLQQDTIHIKFMECDSIVSIDNNTDPVEMPVPVLTSVGTTCTMDADCVQSTPTARDTLLEGEEFVGSDLDGAYCAQGVCMEMGGCLSNSDCFNPVNVFGIAYCNGFLTCTAENKCTNVCGAQNCENGNQPVNCPVAPCDLRIAWPPGAVSCQHDFCSDDTQCIAVYYTAAGEVITMNDEPPAGGAVASATVDETAATDPEDTNLDANADTGTDTNTDTDTGTDVESDSDKNGDTVPTDTETDTDSVVANANNNAVNLEESSSGTTITTKRITSFSFVIITLIGSSLLF